MDPTDEELVSSCQSGSLAAFNALFTRHREEVYRLCYRMVGDADEADDLTQDAFVRAHRGLSGFRGECRFTTWLYRIATNVCHQRLRSRRGAQALPLDAPGVLETLRPPGTGDDPVAVAERRLTAQAVRRAIEELPPHHRAVVVLRDLEDLPYSEIAQVLGCSGAAVKIRVHRARLELRRRLRGLIEGES